MKRKSYFFASWLILVVIFSISCGPKAKAPEAGKARATDLLRLLPKESQGIFVWDVHRAMTTPVARRSLQDKEVAAQIEELKNKSGIDITQDVFLVVAGMLPAEAGESKPVVLANLRYDREKILSLMKEKSPESRETTYSNSVIYYFEPEQKQEMGLCFFDRSNVFLGEVASIKAVIDVSEGKRESIQKNEEINSLIKAVNTDSIVWSAFLLPPEALAELAKSNAMLNPVQKIRSLLMSFDYKNNALMADIKAMGADEAQNKQMAEFLTGLRAMGAMAASKYPEVTEAINRLQITSTAQYVGLSFSLPEDLLLKLGDRVKQEVGQSLPKWD